MRQRRINQKRRKPFTQIVEADTKEQALEWFIQMDATTNCIKFTAKKVKVDL